MNIPCPRFSLLVACFSAILFASCEKKEYQTIEELDEENIRNYIQANGLTVQPFENTGIYYQILQEGTGKNIEYTDRIPMVFTQRSLNGQYQAVDSLHTNSRYADYFGYFPFGSSYAGQPGSPVEKEESMKMVVKRALKKAGGKIRVIVPSRQLWGRNGLRSRGIPPNASIDYTIHVIDDIDQYDDYQIRKAIVNAGYTVDEFTKNNDGVYYKVLSTGSGAPVAIDTTITAQYVLKRTDGQVLEENDEFKIKLNSSNVGVNAWLTVLPNIRRGGKVRLFAPSKQAYGLNGTTGVIPPFLVLDFEITLNME